MNKKEVPEEFAKALPPGWKPSTSPLVDYLYSLRIGGTNGKSRIRRYNLLYSDSRRVARSLNLQQVMQGLESDLQITVALQAKNRLFVHAGVVGWRNRAILIPGRSFSGKSTLVEALVRAGASYYSDEFAVLDAKGRAHPYPRALSLREGDGQARRVEIQDIGGTVGARPPMLALLANTVVARLRPEFALATLKCAIDSVPVLKGSRGEADQAAATILSHLESRAA